MTGRRQTCWSASRRPGSASSSWRTTFAPKRVSPPWSMSYSARPAFRSIGNMAIERANLEWGCVARGRCRGRPVSDPPRTGGEDRQLGGEGALEGGPRLAAGDIGGRGSDIPPAGPIPQPAQHRHHHQVARAERAVEPVGIAEPAGKLAQPVADAVLDASAGAPRTRSCRAPAAWRSSRSTIGGSTVLSAANIQVIARARAFASSGSRPGMALGDMEDDRARSRTGRDRLPHRSGSARTDGARDARAPSSPRTRAGGPRKAGPLPRAPSGRACRAPAPGRDRGSFRRR